jgi:DNA repair exonuclease SbcCD ATPase subunit
MQREKSARPALNLPDTVSNHSSKSVRPRKTKQEKIFELEARLKVAAEENNGLKKDIQKLRDGHGSSRSKNVDTGDVDKMKDTVKAMKRVTVNQEMSLKTLRDKAQHRRKELKDKDSIIYSLQRQVRSLKKAIHGTGNDLEEKLNEMQKTCFEEETRSIELEEKLGKSEQEVRRLKKQGAGGSRGGGLKRILSNGSLKSTESNSTAAEFDVARLKKELANKTNKIVQLEMQLEALNDEMHDFQQHELAGKDEFPADPFATKEESNGFADFNTDFNASATFGDYSDEEDSEEEGDNFW